MVFIFWSGFGFLPLAFAFGGAVLGFVVSDSFAGAGVQIGILATMLPGVGILAAAIPTWLLGKRLNSRPDRVLIDAATGRRVILRRRHHLYWIPMQWWSIPILVLGVAMMVSPPA